MKTKTEIISEMCELAAEMEAFKTNFDNMSKKFQELTKEVGELK